MKRILLALFLLGCASAANAQVGGGICSSPIGNPPSLCTNAQLPMPTGATRVLGSLRAVNMNSTADQGITIPAAVTKWVPTGILATNCTGTLTLAAGGVYPAASKAGTPLVAAAQSYSALTSTTLILPMTLAAGIATTAYTINTVYFSLTTASGGTATCDVYLLGSDLT